MASECLPGTPADPGSRASRGRPTVRRLLALVALCAIATAAWKRYQGAEAIRRGDSGHLALLRFEEANASALAKVPHDRWLARAREAEADYRGLSTDPVREALDWGRLNLPESQHESWRIAYREADRRRKADTGGPLVDHQSCPNVERRRAAHFARLLEKYEFYSLFPWLPIAEDPPAPEYPRTWSSTGPCPYCGEP